MEGVDLVIEEGALNAVVEMALDRGTGARALRSIIEEVMLDIMYALPDRANVSGCTITRDVILGREEPAYTYEERKSA
jgi:ATP-dependent Clp protease ATP-binding subunit ClpX